MLGHQTGASGSSADILLDEGTTLSFCEHCAGQRFDRAQVLRALRAARRTLRERGRGQRADAALAAAISAVRALEIPHLEFEDDAPEDHVVH